MPTTRSQTLGQGLRRVSASTTKKKTLKKRKTEQTAPSILINRAPVLTLWTAVVAEREGHSFEEGLTYGRWVSGVLAQSKGRALGIFTPQEKTEAEKKARKRRDQSMGVHKIDTFGMHVPVVQVENEKGEGSYAVSEGKPIDPDSVYSYLVRSFKNEESTLNAAKEAMQALAGSIPQNQVGKVAYKIYEKIRPEWKGWGGKGHLNLSLIRNLAKNEAWRQEV